VSARESCTCDYCRAGCTRKPGWFLPGEAERAAEFMGLAPPEFFGRYLAVDWWEADDRLGQTFVLSPAIAGEETGTEFPGNPGGTCVFYKDDRCQIHEVKPHECRDLWCGDRSARPIHLDTAKAWSGHQDVISALLGRDPEAELYVGGMFGSLFGGW
jgi:Fe-S-cluster containining protein